MNLQFRARRFLLVEFFVVAFIFAIAQSDAVSLSNNEPPSRHALVDSLTDDDQNDLLNALVSSARDGHSLRNNHRAIPRPFQVQQADFSKRRLSSLRADLGRRAMESAKRYNRLRADLGKRSEDTEEQSDLMSSDEVFEPISEEEKRGRASFRGDLGKRAKSFRGDLGKRAKSFRGDLGKRAKSFRGDLGKRRLRGDLGKRGDDEEKRYKSFRGDLGKRGNVLDDDTFEEEDLQKDVPENQFWSFVDDSDATNKQNSSLENLNTDAE